MLFKFKLPFYAPISSVVNIPMLTNKKILFLKHIFEEPHEKSHEKIFKSNAPLVPALAQTRDFQGCFLMVLEGFSRSAKLNIWPMHSAPNTLMLWLHRKDLILTVRSDLEDAVVLAAIL